MTFILKNWKLVSLSVLFSFLALSPVFMDEYYKLKPSLFTAIDLVMTFICSLWIGNKAVKKLKLI